MCAVYSTNTIRSSWPSFIGTSSAPLFVLYISVIKKYQHDDTGNLPWNILTAGWIVGCRYFGKYAGFVNIIAYRPEGLIFSTLPDDVSVF